MDGSPPETKRLRRNVERQLRLALDPAAVLPMLHRLSRLAPEGTDENVYAQRRLAELLAEQHPWRAALYAKRVLAAHPADDGAWAILALCHAQLGHYKCAVANYRRALGLAPANPAYAHNLGHLMDVALERPREALPWLRAAYEGTGRRADVAVSFAHALGGSGELDEAKRVTARALEARDDGQHMREHVAMLQWLERGAPSDRATPALLARRPPARVGPRPWERTTTDDAPAKAAGSSRRTRNQRKAALDGVLVQGLANLPFDPRQRARARAFVQDPWVVGAIRAHDPTLPSLAAAIAYAIVYVDHVPLTQADVASSFRVSVAALRGRFKALRSHLDLMPGDARFATVRPR
jgi:Flp pilus assembly protein TadD